MGVVVGVEFSPVFPADDGWPSWSTTVWAGQMVDDAGCLIDSAAANPSLSSCPILPEISGTAINFEAPSGIARRHCAVLRRPARLLSRPPHLRSAASGAAIPLCARPRAPASPTVARGRATVPADFTASAGFRPCCWQCAEAGRRNSVVSEDPYKATSARGSSDTSVSPKARKTGALTPAGCLTKS